MQLNKQYLQFDRKPVEVREYFHVCSTREMAKHFANSSKKQQLAKKQGQQNTGESVSPSGFRFQDKSYAFSCLHPATFIAATISL